MVHIHSCTIIILQIIKPKLSEYIHRINILEFILIRIIHIINIITTQ